jgi:arsenate reductase
MPDRIFNVLFLGAGNSARSIMAEVILNKLGSGRLRAFSAGSHPKGAVHPLALKELERSGLPTKGLASKHWNVFAAPDALEMDFIFTVCDRAAGETCPRWLGRPVTAHWRIGRSRRHGRSKRGGIFHSRPLPPESDCGIPQPPFAIAECARA